MKKIYNAVFEFLKKNLNRGCCHGHPNTKKLKNGMLFWTLKLLYMLLYSSSASDVEDVLLGRGKLAIAITNGTVSRTENQ